MLQAQTYLVELGVSLAHEREGGRSSERHGERRGLGDSGAARHAGGVDLEGLARGDEERGGDQLVDHLE